MAARRRWFVRLFLLLLLAVTAVVALAPLVPLDPIKPAIESRLSSFIGRDVTVSSLRLSLLGEVAMVMEGLTAREDPDFGNGNTLEADQVRADLDILDLLRRRRITVSGLSFRNPNFIFTKNSSGAWSWGTLGRGLVETRSGALDNEPRHGFAASFFGILLRDTVDSINSVRVEGASLRLVDGSQAGLPDTLYDSIDLEVAMVREVEGQGSLRATGEFRAASSGTGDLLRARVPFDLRIDREAPSSRQIKGVIGPGPLETENFRVRILKSTLQLAGQRLDLTDLRANIDDGRFEGNLSLDLASRLFGLDGRVEEFDIDGGIGSKLGLPGQVVGNVDATFRLRGTWLGFLESVPTVTGSGKVRSSSLFLAAFNAAEQLKAAFNLRGIGDEGPGTKMESFEGDFQIDRGTVIMSNVTIRGLDAIGDATVSRGWIRFSESPVLDYPASLTLTRESTRSVKQANPLIAAAISLVERDGRVTVPIRVSGNLLNPDFQVDARRFR